MQRYVGFPRYAPQETRSRQCILRLGDCFEILFLVTRGGSHRVIMVAWRWKLSGKPRLPSKGNPLELSSLQQESCQRLGKAVGRFKGEFIAVNIDRCDERSLVIPFRSVFWRRLRSSFISINLLELGCFQIIESSTLRSIHWAVLRSRCIPTSTPEQKPIP